MQTNCWILHRRGQAKGRPFLGVQLAYRVIYERWRGPIPKGMHAHHVCENKQCVNPWHIELMTLSDHTKHHRPRNKTGLRTHCKHGHEFTDANTHRTPSGARRCKTCRLQWAQQDRIRKGIAPGREGTKNSQAKLTDSAVREIRQAQNVPRGTLAKLQHKYGISRTTIKNIRTRKRWTHVRD